MHLRMLKKIRFHVNDQDMTKYTGSLDHADFTYTIFSKFENENITQIFSLLKVFLINGPVVQLSTHVS